MDMATHMEIHRSPLDPAPGAHSPGLGLTHNEAEEGEEW